MELFAKICNGRVYNQWTVFACHCGNSTSLQANLKSNENGHALKAASDTISSFADMFFIFFQKCQLLSVSVTFCFILKTNCKNEKWYHCRFHLPGFFEQKQPSTYILQNVVDNMQEKQLWKSSFLKKLKAEKKLL